MMKKTTYIMISLAVAMFAAAGCAKQETGTQGPANLMAIQPEVVSADGALKSADGGATKAKLINNATGLQGQGFGLSVYNGDTPVYSNLKMQYSNGSWAPESGGPLKWPAGTAYSFYAWSPASLITNSGSSTFTYSDIAKQEDIMLGYYTGTGNTSGNTCSAPVKFSHPLASVQFQVGTMTGLSKINSIKLSGVRPQGTCTVNTATPPTYSWSISNETAVVELTQTKEVSTLTEGTPIGDPFLLLPQPLNTDNITVTLNVTPTSGSAKDISFKITSGIPTMGKTTIYKVNYNVSSGLSFSTPTVTAWGEGDNLTAELKEEGKVYWVDLGMVSQNGHKLYVANYDVESIDADGNITFADSEDKTPIKMTFAQLNGRTEFTAPGGKVCRLMSVPEAKDFYCDFNDFSGTEVLVVPNKNISWNRSSYLGTSNINGETIQLSSDAYLLISNGKNGVLYPSSSSENVILTTEYGGNITASCRLRMVYEDQSVTYPITNKIVYKWEHWEYDAYSELKDYSIESKDYRVDPDQPEFHFFVPVISYEGTDFVSNSSIITIEDCVGDGYDDLSVYKSAYSLTFGHTKTRTITLSYAGETIIVFKAHGSNAPM